MKKPGKAGEEKLAPVTRTHLEAQTNYDRLSRWYDLIEGGWESRPRRLALQFLAPKPGEQILEIGCGTGTSLLELARAVGDRGRVFGFDISPGMLLVAGKKLGRAGLSNRVELHQGDALHLPCQAASMDAIFMAFTLELFDTPEIPQVLAECRRVLRREARLAAVSMSKLGGLGGMQRAYEWFHVKFPRTIDCRPICLRNALEQNGFPVSKYQLLSLTGLGVEIVLAHVKA